MSFRLKVWAILDVLLRVPPVFVMDAVLNSCFSLSSNGGKVFNSSHPFLLENSEEFASESEENSFGHEEVDSSALVWFFLYSKGFMAALVIFMLSTQQLLSVYLWMASLGVILWSYILNDDYIKFSTELIAHHSSILYEMFSASHNAIFRFSANYCLQMFFAIIFCFSSASPPTILPKTVMGLTFIFPTIISILPLPSALLKLTPFFGSLMSLAFLLSYLMKHVKKIIRIVYDNLVLSRSIIRHYGLYTFVENQWLRLHVPQVLKVFWITRITEQAVFLIASAAHTEYKTQGFITVTLESSLIIAKQLLIRGCETFVAVLGMTSVISSISHYIGYAMQSFLLLEDSEDRSIGTISAVLFFILALQTGLTGMDPEKRFLRLYRNLCLLFTAILHFIHGMVNPLLLSLSASTNTSLSKHSRALAVCTFLVAFPCWFVVFLGTRHSISTWLLAVSAFSIEVVIKVIISLLVYGLFMIDAYRNTFWEKLDDYVYYIRATGSSIEFIFGIFLFFNGAWILLFESGGTIRAFMMCIHAYFNIWLQAKSGWKVFINRRSAVNKINSLPEATAEQLIAFDDVCAICYQELNNARITRCNHYFHGVCLRKWLYVQDICPLCHKTLYSVETDEDIEQNADNPDAPVQHEHQD